VNDQRANLLDVNFLVALAWPNHIAHNRAVSWFLEHKEMPFATCPITESGFVRISMNPLIVSEQTSVKAATTLLETYTLTYPHIFWADDLDIGTALSSYRLITGHRQITDAYLLALAVKHDGNLVTFDGGIYSLAPPEFRSHIIHVE